MTILYLALAWLAGVAIVRAVLPAPPNASLHNLFTVALGAGLGIGITSSVYFLCLASFGPDRKLIAFAEALVLVLALVANFVLKRRGAFLKWGAGPPVPWYLTGLFGFAVAAAIAMFVAYTMAKPHGDWDAWSIWNLRARFLFRGGKFWTDAFSTDIGWSHPDYPLLVSGIVALCWTLANTEWIGVQIGVAGLFVFGTAAVLIGALGVLRGKAQALVAGAVLLGTVAYVQGGATQYADVPLSFYILAAVALLCLQDRFPEDSSFTILAGLAAGLSAWTKNEGLLFVVALVLARAFAIFRFGNRAQLLPQFLRLGAGLIAPLAIVALFKLRYAPANDLMSRPSSEALSHLGDISRWLYTAEGYVKMVFRFGGFLIPIAVILALYWFLVRFKVEQRDRQLVATAIAAVTLMLAGDFAVYVLLPADVVWQLNTSLDRVFLQLWPAGLFAAFLAFNQPQLAAKPAQAEKPKSEKRQKRAGR